MQFSVILVFFYAHFTNAYNIFDFFKDIIEVNKELNLNDKTLNYLGDQFENSIKYKEPKVVGEENYNTQKLLFHLIVNKFEILKLILGQNTQNEQCPLSNATKKILHLYLEKTLKNIRIIYIQLKKTLPSVKNKNWCIEDDYNSYSDQTTLLEFLSFLIKNEYHLLPKFYDLKNGTLFIAINESFNFPKLENHKGELKETFKNVLDNLNPTIRKCDPKKYIRNKNYLQFNNLIRGSLNYINGNLSVLNQQITCSGNEFQCKIVRNGEACISNFRVYPHRTLDFLRKDGQLMGRQQYCHKEKLIKLKNNQLCYCDEEGIRSDRYISLRPVSANITENMVITGLRFVKISRIIQLQIQQGKLLAGGLINQSSVNWALSDENNFKITDFNVKMGIDYFKFNIPKKNNKIIMEELEIQEQNYFLTGIRFTKIQDRHHHGVQLELTLTEFNPETGKLIDGHKHTKTLKSSNFTGSSYKPENCDVPTYTDKPSQLWPQTSSYPIELFYTDLYKDVAQTTVPFLDSQEVTSPFSALPLIGAGLYYKTSKGYGGFIAPSIKPYKIFNNNVL